LNAKLINKAVNIQGNSYAKAQKLQFLQWHGFNTFAQNNICMKKLLSMAAIMAATTSITFAQDNKAPEPPVKQDKKFYTSSSLDGALFSLNAVTNNGFSNIPRFAYFLNTGINFNYDLGRHFGIYTGVGVKNLGYIDKSKDLIPGHEVTIKHRVYALGVPVGVKIGNLGDKGTFMVLGGGADFPVNYKEKTFIDSRKHKSKESEWFSDEVSPIMPYVFAGVSFNSKFTVKFQYYPGNFMADDYWLTSTAPTMGKYDTHLALVSLSFYVKNKNNGQTRKAFRAMLQQRKANKKA
jgi:hypothetical protein